MKVLSVLFEDFLMYLKNTFIYKEECLYIIPKYENNITPSIGLVYTYITIEMRNSIQQYVIRKTDSRLSDVLLI